MSSAGQICSFACDRCLTQYSCINCCDHVCDGGEKCRKQADGCEIQIKPGHAKFSAGYGSNFDGASFEFIDAKNCYAQNSWLKSDRSTILCDRCVRDLLITQVVRWVYTDCQDYYPCACELCDSVFINVEKCNWIVRKQKDECWRFEIAGPWRFQDTGQSPFLKFSSLKYLTKLLNNNSRICDACFATFEHVCGEKPQSVDIW